MRHPERLRPCFAHVVKNDDRADHASVAAVDRSGRVLDGEFQAVAPDENAVRFQGDGLVPLDCEPQGIAHQPLSRRAVHDLKHFVERPTLRLAARPARHRLRGRVEIHHVARDVGAEDSVTDGVESELGVLRLARVVGNGVACHENTVNLARLAQASRTPFRQLPSFDLSERYPRGAARVCTLTLIRWETLAIRAKYACATAPTHCDGRDSL